MLLVAKTWAIDAVVTHTHFYAPLNETKGTKPYFELSWEINPYSLRFTTNESGAFLAKIRTDIIIRNENGIATEDHFILQTIAAGTVDEARQHSIRDLRKYNVAPGHYTITVKLTELPDSANTFSYSQEAAIDTPLDNSAYYSGIQLLDTFYNSTEQSRFLRSDKYQLPLSTNFLDDNRNSLHYYLELNKSSNIKPEQYPIVQLIYISKKMQEGLVQKLKRTDTIKGADILPFIGSFDISALPSGNYYLNATLQNFRSETIAARSIFFQRSNKNPTSGKDSIAAADTGVQQLNILDLNNTFVGKYTVQQLMAIIKMLWPVATPVEQTNIKSFLKKPDLIYMQYFVYNFWMARDKGNPKKAWEQYTERVRETNKLFGKGGYETERGQVYLKYGKPTERIIVENEQGSLPYEVWQYNITEKMSNGIFLFYRPSNMIVDMQLLHSNIPGEVRNASWRNMLYLPNSNNDHANARVEQYFYKK
jgi:GWxTD domain-containing protein